MQVRMLAYGGTHFAERARIGAWPPIPEATLQDTYGLPADALSYGLGVLREAPFLIVRQRQSVAYRGDFPYTILLEPGEPVWWRFGWNAAHLLLAMLRTPVCSQLLTEPESLTADVLEGWLAGLSAAPAEWATSEQWEGLRAACTGSAILMRFAQDRPSMVVTPAALGLAGRPEVPHMAAALAGLPPCFRCARGWLVGGDAAHGPALGARLILDEQGGPHAELAESDLSECRRHWSWWRAVAVLPGFSDLLWTHQPVWRWPGLYGVSAIEVTAMLAVLGELEAEDVSQLLAASRDSPAALIQLGRAARSESESIRAQLLRRGVEAPPALVKAARGTWKTPAADLPRLVERELGRWQADFSGPQVRVLVDVALHRAAQNRTPLREWAALREEPVVGERIQRWLQQSAAARLLLATPEAVADYLTFAADPGGVLYAATDPPAGQPDSIVSMIMDARRGAAALEAMSWLQRLATSPLRAKLSLEVKRKVAGQEPEAWASFRCLAAPFSGQTPDAPPPCPDQEREYLLAELRELIAGPGIETARANLPMLDAWLGPLPEDLRRALEPAPQVRARAAAAGAATPPTRATILLPEAPATTGEPSLKDKLRQCLFGPYASQDEERGQELADLLQQGERTLSTLLDAVIVEWAETSGHLFARRYLSQPDLLRSLFANLSEKSRQHLVGCLARDARFVEQAAQLVKKALDERASPGRFLQTVVAYLLSERGAGLYGAFLSRFRKPPDWVRQQLERLRQ